MIVIEVKDAKITETGLALALETTNSEQPNKTYVVSRTYDTGQSAGDIQTAIENDVRLLWLAAGVGSWQINP